jgi:hypothetical protein
MKYHRLPSPAEKGNVPFLVGCVPFFRFRYFPMPARQSRNAYSSATSR